MRQANLFAITAVLVLLAVSGPAAGAQARHRARKGPSRETALAGNHSRRATRSPVGHRKIKSGGPPPRGVTTKRAVTARFTPMTDTVIAAGAQYTPPTPEQLAVLKAESKSEHQVADLVRTGDLATAMAVCRSAMAASSGAHGGVAVPRLRHMLGTIYLAAGFYDDAYRIFGDIGHHNREAYVCEDFDLDVALAAVGVGNPRHAEALVRKYLSRFQTWQGRPELLPGFSSPAQAMATVRAVRGVNKLCTAQWDEAAKELALAAQVAPYNAYIAVDRGTALAALGRFPEAEACLGIAARSRIPDLSVFAQLSLDTVREAVQKKAAASTK